MQQSSFIDSLCWIRILCFLLSYSYVGGFYAVIKSAKVHLYCHILQEQKRLQEQFAAEQEALFGSRPKKPLGQTNTMVGTPIGRRVSTPSSRHGVSSLKERRESGRVNNVIPLNFVALPKDDSVSRGS